MLHVFRKYQQYIFIVITFVIVISFSFFGTYSSMQSSSYEDPVAFVAIDGTSITRSELEQFVNFIGTDSEEKRNYGGVWGPNFFNDGVIKKDFLENGIASVLVKGFADDINPDLKEKLTKEKLYTLYSHPQAKFISTDSAWKYFVPGMTQSFTTLKNAKDPLDSAAFDARVKLFLGQRRFPPQLLRHMLKMQEKQYNWLQHDQNLDYADLSLFGYHKAEDWFGPRMVRLIAEFIINSSIIAKEHGYVVTKGEALTDLISNASSSFNENQNSPQMNVANVDQYMKEQLRRMGLDQTKAVNIWQKVLLFRRLYQDVGNSVFADPFTFQAYNDYSQEGVTGTLYQLPQELHFGEGSSLQKFETYLDGISNRPALAKDRLNMPKSFKTPAQVAKTTPELVQKRYLVDISEVSKKDLESKVALKEMWNWETEENNWKTLEKQFPELALAKAKNKEERNAALNALDNSTRSRIATFARSEIVDKHPEWIEKALNNSIPKTMTLNIPLSGGEIYIKGVKDRTALFDLLDKPENSRKLNIYSADGSHYYRINVLDRSENPEIVTYAEANSSGVLDTMVEAKMMNHYEKIRSKYPQEYQNADKSWKNFSEVSNNVAGHYYNDLVKAIGDHYIAAFSPDDKSKLSLARASSLRLLKHAVDTRTQFAQNKTSADESQSNESSQNNKLAARQPLEKQWAFNPKPFETKRSSRDGTLDKTEILAMNKDDWTKVYTPGNGDLYFFQVESTENSETQENLANQVETIHHLLAGDAQRTLATKFITMMNKKGAISLEYLNTRFKNLPEEES
ncbi:MAG: SurA N-terminal domain-containing protein [Chlamydiota bacterium]|nr:SurA N-terminal domain-containing protein [Chlamydiota bacterium]